MTLVAALIGLCMGMVYVLWPLIRHLEPTTVARDFGQRDRDSVLLAIEEIDLDQASGRLSDEEAGRRSLDARVRAQTLLEQQISDPLKTGHPQPPA